MESKEDWIKKVSKYGGHLIVWIDQGRQLRGISSSGVCFALVMNWIACCRSSLYGRVEFINSIDPHLSKDYIDLQDFLMKEYGQKRERLKALESKYEQNKSEIDAKYRLTIEEAIQLTRRDIYGEDCAEFKVFKEKIYGLFGSKKSESYQDFIEKDNSLSLSEYFSSSIKGIASTIGTDRLASFFYFGMIGGVLEGHAIGFELSAAKKSLHNEFLDPNLGLFMFDDPNKMFAFFFSEVSPYFSYNLVHRTIELGRFNSQYLWE